MAKNIKGRKFVATAASAALVASAIVPVASAAADFADQSKISSWAAEAVEHAVEQGYMKGSNGSFNPQGTITKAEVAQVIFNALDLAPVTGGSFTDVPADAWFAGAVNAVAAKGIVSGTGAGTFEPNKAVTLAEAANMIVKALGIKGQADLSKFADASSVPTWANEAIQALVANGYIEGASNNGVLTLGALDNLSRERFATFFVATAVDTIEAGEQTGPVAVKDLTVVGAKKLELTFANKVDATEKAVLTVKKGTINVNIDEWKFSDDKKSVVITTTTKLSKGDYTVTLSGLTDEAISKTVTAADEKVSTINVLSTTAPMNEAAQPIDGVNYAANQTAFVKYAVLNQYGEKMNISGITWTQSTGGKVLDNTTTGTLVIGNTVAAGVNFIPNAKVYLTGVHGASATVVNAEVTIGLPSRVATVEVAGVYDKSANKFVDLAANFANNRYVLLFTAKDQYGNVMNLTSSDSLTLISDNPLFIGQPTLTDDVAVGNDVYEALTLVPGQQPEKGGTATIQIISNNTGSVAKYTIKADATAAVTSFQMSLPADIIAGKEPIEVPFVALDQYGNQVTKYSDLVGANAAQPNVNVSATSGSIKFELQKDGSAKLKYTAQSNGTQFDSVVSLTSTVKANGNYSNIQLSVKPDAVPTTVIGLNKDISTSVAKNGGVATITADDLLVQDQYGRTMTASTIKAWLDASVPGADNAIVVESNSAATTAFAVTSTQTSTDSALVVMTNSTDEVYVATNVSTATAESLKFSLSTSATPTAVTTSSKTVTFTAVAQSQFVKYELAEVGTVYNDGVAASLTSPDYNAPVIVYGVTESGDKVEIPTGLYTVTVTSGKLQSNGDNELVDVPNGYVPTDFQEPITSAPKTLTAKISVVVKDAATQAAAAVLTQDVTVSNATPVAATFRLHRDVTNDTAFVSATTDATATIDATTLKGFITQVKDQYGVVLADATFGSPRTITVSNVVKTAGSSITVVNNVTANAKLENAKAGDKFTVTYTYVGGKTVTINFVVAAQ